MEQRMTFDELWEQEERQGLLSRLQKDYPEWQQRRKRRRTMAAVAIAAVAVLSPVVFHSSPTQTYDYICCNRSDIPEMHWVDVASNILTIDII